MNNKRWKAFGLAVLVVLSASAFGVFTSLNGQGGRSSGRFAAGGFSSPRDLITFLNVDGSRLSRPDMDDAIFRLLALQTSAMKEHEAQLFSDGVNPAINRYLPEDLADIENIKEEAIRDLVAAIHSDQLRISSSEGMHFIEIDYPAIRSRYAAYASESLAAYLDIMARETEHHFAEDAALMVSPDELGGRLAAIEAFVNRNPDFPLIDDIKRLQSFYLPALLLGLNNTPAFESGTGQIKESFLRSYRNLVQKHAGTHLTGLIQDYLGVLEQNRFQKAPAVLDFTRNAVTRL